MARQKATPKVAPTQNGSLAATDQKTDYTRWRLRDERGQQIWEYITPEQAKKWPQSTAERYHLGLSTDLPKLSKAHTAKEAARNGLKFFSNLQMNLGNWSCEYGGPMFLLPGVVYTWYMTGVPIPEHYKIEIRNYLFARAHPEDGGWGLHIEGDSSVFGCTINYVVLRICGAEADDPRMVKARATLHKLGGAVNGPHWAKFWLSAMGVMQWDIVNPAPPELWLLPDWVPIAPWRWWIHMRMVFLPMSFIWSRKWVMPETELVRELRQEIFTKPYEEIDFASHRNTIAATDNYHPKTWVLNLLNWFLVYLYIPLIRSWNKSFVRRAEDRVWWLVQMEDENTDYSDLAPVNSPMNMLVCYIKEGTDSHSFRMHRDRLDDFIWVKSEGMLVNGTNGVQSWDTAFTIQATIEAGLDQEKEFGPMLNNALEYLDSQQIREECKELKRCYRQPRLGAWGFSTRGQGYTVSDCTAEGAKAVIMLQSRPGFPTLVSADRIFQAVDILLTMQNKGSGGCSSYEPARGSELLEWLNAAEVFGKIMVEYDYVECTSSVIIGLAEFTKLHPRYRAAEIARYVNRAVAYIHRSQRADGSWYGAWGICFTYAGMFALEALAAVGETYENSETVRRGVKFLLEHQMEDGGWGETYKSCETGVYCQHEKSQVVQTAWALIALCNAQCPEREPMEKAARLIMGRQQPNGEWLQESIEGVFNKSCMISYPSYKFIFPIKALGMFAKRFGDVKIQ